jgi:hypothetical protein
MHVHVPFDIDGDSTQALSHIRAAIRDVVSGPARVLFDADIVLHLPSMRYGVYGYALVKDIEHINSLRAAGTG